MEVAKHVTTYTYASGFKIIRTVEDEYVRCNLPGSSEKALRKVRTKTTVQDTFVKPLNLSLTSEIIEGLILYDEDEKDGVPFKASPRVFADELSQDTDEDAIEDDENTTQKTLEDTISKRTTHIGRTHDNVLIKRDVTYNKLTGFTKTQSQILDNPKKDAGDLRNDDIFRKEYHPDGSGVAINGLTCYHPPKTINHSDIDNETIADAIAERAFNRKTQEANDEWAIDIPVPWIPEYIGTIVTLPDFQVYVNDSLVTVSGGDFVLRQAELTFAFDGNKAVGSSKWTVRAKY